ncbi:hypothetical protein GF345_00995 [Candidatus Woesearchaeota archaeon]|nr:hypothetical protein [Candidatus Woesearchaeota archaeon]
MFFNMSYIEEEEVKGYGVSFRAPMEINGNNLAGDYHQGVDCTFQFADQTNQIVISRVGVCTVPPPPP